MYWGGQLGFQTHVQLIMLWELRTWSLWKLMTRSFPYQPLPPWGHTGTPAHLLAGWPKKGQKTAKTMLVKNSYWKVYEAAVTVVKKCYFSATIVSASVQLFKIFWHLLNLSLYWLKNRKLVVMPLHSVLMTKSLEYILTWLVVVIWIRQKKYLTYFLGCLWSILIQLP